MFAKALQRLIPPRIPAARSRLRETLSWISALALASATGLASADSPQFRVIHARTVLVDQVYRLEAKLGYRFSAEALDALKNGVPLFLVLDIEVYQPRRYLWENVLADLKQRYQIQYHALSDKYLLRNLNSGSQATFTGLDDALAWLGGIGEIPIIDAHLLSPGERYMVRVRSRLDIDKLPVPLRLEAYISSEWWLTSGWYSWDL
jgi:hypothetical protein